MSATVYEKPDSRSTSLGSQNTHQRECWVFDAADEQAAIVAMLNDTGIFPITTTITTAYGAIPFVRDRASVKPAEDNNAAGGPTTWEGSVSYVQFSKQPMQPGESVVNFQIGFQSVNIKQAIATVDSDSTLVGGAPNIGTLINVTDEGCEGVELEVPTFTWSETHIFADADVDAAWFAAVYAIANAPVNDDTFRGFAAGEVKFMGVQGSRRFKDGDWELTFQFAGSPNKTSVVFGSVPGVAKKGWEYAWARYAWDRTTGPLKFLFARDAYVSKIYNTSDFDGLGIGSSSLL